MMLIKTNPDNKERSETFLFGIISLVVSLLCLYGFYSNQTASSVLLWLGVFLGIYGLVYFCLALFGSRETCRKALSYVPPPF